MNTEQRMAILGRSAPPKPSPEKKLENKILKDKLPPGFGPGHPLFKVPSYRNKWLMMQGVTFANTPKFTKKHYGLSPAEDPNNEHYLLQKQKAQK